MPTSNDTDQTGYWNDRAARYDELKWVNNPDLVGWTADAIRHSMPPSMDQPRAFEIGPGTGALTRLLSPFVSERRGTYDAIELSPDMAAKCRSNCRLATVQEGGWESIPRGPAYDIVIARMVLRHQIDPWESLEQWIGLLNRGGIIAIAEGPPPTDDWTVETFYGASMAVKHGSARTVVHASALVESMLQLGLTVKTFERFTEGNSLEEWLSAGAVPVERAQVVRSMTRNASRQVQRAYNMEITPDDVLMRWRHCVVVGQAP